MSASLVASSTQVMASEFIADLKGNAAFQFETHLDVFTDDAATRTDREIDNSNVTSFNKLNIETNADVSDNVLFNLSVDALVNLNNTQRGIGALPDDEDVTSRFVDVNSAYFTYEADYYDLVVGKAFHNTGFAEINSIIDRFNVSNMNNPIHSVKNGTWQGKGVLYLDEWMDYEDSLTFAVMPYDKAAGGIPSDSRWLGNSSDGDFFLSNLTLTDRYRSNDARNWQFLLEYQGVRDGYDFVAGVSRGASDNPVVRTEVRGFTRSDYKLYPTAHTAYSGISVTDENLQAYAEVLVQDVINGKDEDTVHGVVGLTYKETDWSSYLWLDEVTPTLEYSRERVINEQSNSQYTIASTDARSFRNTLSGRVKIVYDSDYTLYLGTNKNLKDKDYLHNFKFEYKHNDSNYVYLNGFMFGGKVGTQFGRWAENDLLSVGYVHKF